MPRAQFNGSFSRITLASAVAVLMGTTLVACERNTTDAETTSRPAGEQQRDDRVTADQPSSRETTGQSSMGQGQTGTMGGQSQTGTMGSHGQGQTGTMGGQGQTGTMGAQQDVMAPRDQACPMVVESASIEVEETADGVALRFTSTTADNVDDLRNRVEHMARMYEMHGGGQGQGGSMMWQHMGHRRADQSQAGAGRQGPTGAMPAATAKVENIDKGARLVLTPKDGSQLAALREHARDHERRMESGECWMAQSQDDQPGHRPGESAPGDGRPKT